MAGMSLALSPQTGKNFGVENSYSHCASQYEASRQRDRCPANALIRRILGLGVNLDAVLDFGAGAGFWLDTMARAGLAAGPNVAIDISEEMLAVASKRIRNTHFIHGGVESVASREVQRVDCIFLGMVAHLLDFPKDIARLSVHAAENHVRHLVIVEEISFLYHVAVGNLFYLKLLPEDLRKALLLYIDLRAKYKAPALTANRSAPFPTPSLSVDAWRRLDVRAFEYHFETPREITWTWQFSVSDLLSQIRSRMWSVCFCHTPAIAERIAKEMAEALAKIDFDRKHDLPFWFNLHVFTTYCEREQANGPRDRACSH